MILAFMAGAKPRLRDRHASATAGREPGGAVGRNQILYTYAGVGAGRLRARHRRGRHPAAAGSRRRRRTWPSTSCSGTACATAAARTRTPPATRSPWASACATPTRTAPSRGQIATPAAPQARDDGRLRARERHAPRLPRDRPAATAPPASSRRPWDRHERQYDCGGEELWGFVPFDQLGRLRSSTGTSPRPAPTTSTCSPGASASPTSSSRQALAGASRRRRGRSTMRARGSLDAGRVAADPVLRPRHRRQVHDGARRDGPGPYTAPRLETGGPIPVWNRATRTPRTASSGACPNNSTDARDRTAYAAMGQTWSIPVVGYVDRTRPIYARARADRGQRTTSCSWDPGTATPRRGDHLLHARRPHR